MLTKICLLFSFIFITSIYAMELESSVDSHFVSSKEKNNISLPNDISKNLHIYFIKIYFLSSSKLLRHQKSLKFLTRYILATCSSREEINRKLVENLAKLIELSHLSFGKNPRVQMHKIFRDNNFNQSIQKGCLKKFAETKLCISKYPLLKEKLLTDEAIDCCPNVVIDCWGYDELSTDKTNVRQQLKEGFHIDCDAIHNAIVQNNIELLKLFFEYNCFLVIYNFLPCIYSDLIQCNYEMLQLIKTEGLKFFYPLNSVEEIVKYRMDVWHQSPIDILIELYPIFHKDLFYVLKSLPEVQDLPEELKIAIHKENIDEVLEILKYLSERLIHAIDVSDMKSIEFSLNLGISDIVENALGSIIFSKNMDCVKTFIQQLKNIDKNLIKLALTSNSLEILKSVLSKPGAIDMLMKEDIKPYRGVTVDSIHVGCTVDQCIELIKAGARWQEAFDYDSPILGYLHHFSQSDMNRLLPYVIDDFKKLINIKYKGGNTALMTLVRRDEVEKWKYDLLISLGSDTTLKNDSGETLLDIALSSKLDEAVSTTM